MSDSKFLDSCSKESGRAAGVMSSVAVAHKNTRAIGELLAPGLPGKVQIDRVYRELNRAFPEISTFTRRRVRAFFFGENRRADHEEVAALEKLKALEEARREHRQFVQTTTRLAAHLAAEGAALNRTQVAALARITGGQADLPGDYHAGSRGTLGGMAGARAGGAAR